MPDTLSPEARKRVRAFCEGILGDLNLPDTEIEELEGHFQDRMLGYLSGEDPLTEEDAFLLTREHFGDAAVVRELFADAMPGASRVSGRRWHLLGAALLFIASILSVPSAVFAFRHSSHAYLLMVSLFYVASLLMLGLVVVFIRPAHIRMTDRAFGWYFLALLLGNALLLGGAFLCGSLPLSELRLMPLRICLTILELAMILAVAISFFRHAASGRWLLLALLLLPFLSGMARTRLDGEAHAMYTANAGDLYTEDTPPNREPVTEPSSAVVLVKTAKAPSITVVQIPPKGFSQVLYVLALLHAFLPRRPGRVVPVRTPRIRDTA